MVVRRRRNIILRPRLLLPRSVPFPMVSPSWKFETPLTQKQRNRENGDTHKRLASKGRSLGIAAPRMVFLKTFQKVQSSVPKVVGFNGKKLQILDCQTHFPAFRTANKRHLQIVCVLLRNSRAYKVNVSSLIPGLRTCAILEQI